METGDIDDNDKAGSTTMSDLFGLNTFGEKTLVRAQCCPTNGTAREHSRLSASSGLVTFSLALLEVVGDNTESEIAINIEPESVLLPESVLVPQSV